MSDPLIDGGQGRRAESIHADGVTTCWLILAAIVLLASCIGCTRREASNMRGEGTQQGVLMANPLPAGESVDLEEMARTRAEIEEMESKGLSLKRLTGN